MMKASGVRAQRLMLGQVHIWQLLPYVVSVQVAKTVMRIAHFVFAEHTASIELRLKRPARHSLVLRSISWPLYAIGVDEHGLRFVPAPAL
jgi:hypothetical protein